MDFQENRQTDAQDTLPAQQPSSSADGTLSADNHESAGQNRPPYENSGASPYQKGQPYQNRPPYGNGTPYPAPQQPRQNNSGSIPQPYGGNQSAPHQNAGGPYRNNMPYGAQYPNGNPNQYPGGYRPDNYGQQNRYNNNANNNNKYPYYGRNTYQIPVSEPGGSLAKAAMICGILSIVFCFIFPIYPTFSLSGVAIILALLSRGRQTKMLSKARTGTICAIIGLAFNVMVIVSSVVPVLTDPEEREKFIQTQDAIQEMFEDMMENDGYYDFD